MKKEEKKIEIIKLDEFLENIKKFENKENKENVEKILDNKENEENSSKLLLASKKIQKTPTVNISAARKALEDLTTLCRNKAALEAQRKPLITKSFAEDIQKQTRNYVKRFFLCNFF